MSEFDSRAKVWESNPVHTQRTQAVEQEIRRRVPLSPSMRALEVGCGTGLLSFALQKDLGTILLTDTSEGMLGVLREKIATAGITNMEPLLLDLAEASPSPESFDILYLQMALHHMDDVDGMLRTFYSLLKEGGYLCIADVVLEDGSFHGEGFTGHNGFDQTDLQAKCRHLGFQDLESSVVHEMERGSGENKRLYPIFLLTGRK